MIRLLINGIHGQMGRALCKAAEESDSFTVSGGVDRVVDAAFPYPIFPDYPSVNVPYDVIIDFSVPAALEEATDMEAHYKGEYLDHDGELVGIFG